MSFYFVTVSSITHSYHWSVHNGDQVIFFCNFVDYTKGCLQKADFGMCDTSGIPLKKGPWPQPSAEPTDWTFTTAHRLFDELPKQSLLHWLRTEYTEPSFAIDFKKFATADALQHFPNMRGKLPPYHEASYVIVLPRKFVTRYCSDNQIPVYGETWDTKLPEAAECLDSLIDGHLISKGYTFSKPNETGGETVFNG